MAIPTWLAANYEDSIGTLYAGWEALAEQMDRSGSPDVAEWARAKAADARAAEAEKAAADAANAAATADAAAAGVQ